MALSPETNAIVKASEREFDRRGFVVSSALLAGAAAFALMVPESARATVPAGFTLTVPGSLNFEIRADGTLVGPSSEALRIVNGTDGVEIRVTSLKATSGSGYSFVTDSAASAEANALQVSIGPDADMINLGNATGANGVGVTDELAWTMASPDRNADLSCIPLSTSGSIANYDAEALRTQAYAGSIDWYLANDTLTDEILERTETFEETNEEIAADVEELYALLTASGTIPREVYASNPVNGTVTVDTTPALWFNKDDSQLYLVSA